MTLDEWITDQYRTAALNMTVPAERNGTIFDGRTDCRIEMRPTPHLIATIPIELIPDEYRAELPPDAVSVIRRFD